ncbi:hypothetical protein ACI79G_12830 [Geodermatophilus sp. SYSU D00779]
MELGGTSVPGLRTAATRIYYDTASGEVVHIHRVAVGPGQEVDFELQVAIDAFDEWLRLQHGAELKVLDVEDSDIPTEGPIRVNISSRALVPRH